MSGEDPVEMAIESHRRRLLELQEESQRDDQAISDLSATCEALSKRVDALSTVDQLLEGRISRLERREPEPFTPFAYGDLPARPEPTKNPVFSPKTYGDQAESLWKPAPQQEVALVSPNFVRQIGEILGIEPKTQGEVLSKLTEVVRGADSDRATANFVERWATKFMFLSDRWSELDFLEKMELIQAYIYGLRGGK